MTTVGLIILAISLFAVAAAFLAAELFFPSHGLLGICAGGAAIGGVVAIYWVSPLLGALGAVALVIVAPFVVYYAIKYYPESAVGKKVMLNQMPTDAFTREIDELSALVGHRGVAVTLLRPAGIAEIAGRRVECLSDGEIVAAGTPVEVVSVAGLKVVVKAVPAA